MKSKSKYKVIGLMSGTSLDGLDVVYSIIKKKKKGWSFEIKTASTFRYNASWKQKLSTAHLLPANELFALDVEYGKFLGETSLSFIQKNKIKHVDFISSHGHTIFHQPQRGFTFQLGSGLALHESSSLPVVYDFRSLDVSRGGQGAPLVPIGDQYLFSDYDCCLNLGGIANLSMEEKGKRTAFDICFVNMGLNYLSALAGREFDKNGLLAKQGIVHKELLTKLDKLYFSWRKKRPSLGREMFEKEIQPLLDNDQISVQDRLRTFCESIAIEIEKAIPASKRKLNVITTGGGAFNKFLIDCIADKLSHKASIDIPSDEVINFKEGLIFGLLGVLRVRNEINCLKSVTGARQDSSGGIMVGL